MMPEEQFRAAIDTLSKQLFDAVKDRGPVRFDIAIGALMHLIDVILRSAPETERNSATLYVLQALEGLAQHIAEHSCGPSRPPGPLNWGRRS
jgi:hypothetical protein